MPYLRGAFTTRRYTNPCLPYLTFTLLISTPLGIYSGWPLSRPHKIPTFPVGAAKDSIIYILFNAMVNSHCFTLRKNRSGSQGFKYCNRLTEDYNSVNKEHIHTPGPQAGNSCNLSFSACSNSKMKQILVTLTFSIFTDHFGIPWLFQVFQVSGHPVYYCQLLLQVKANLCTVFARDNHDMSSAVTGNHRLQLWLT